MEKISLLTIFILILSIINSKCADLCKNTPENEYKIILPHTPFEIKLDPTKEVCLKYEFDKNNNNMKKNISLSFLKGNSYTAEVILYNSYDKIKKENGNYTEYAVAPYIIALHEFQEINSDIFGSYIYIILRDSKSNYYYRDYLTIYDSNIPIELKENTPFTINKFMLNKEYTFTFESKNDIIISYSSKTKGKKSVEFIQNNNQIASYNDDNDIIQNFTSSNSDLNDKYKIIIKIVSEYSDKKIAFNQEFSIIYYENLQNFQEVEVSTIKKINYLISNSQEQLFYFYIKTNQSTLHNTINFEMDYNNKNEKYIYITTNEYTDEMSDIAPKSYKWKSNTLASVYDVDSDEIVRYYFTSKAKYILILVKINNLAQYKKPKYFKISYGEDVRTKTISSATDKVSIGVMDYITNYIQFKIENEKKYLFYAPYEQYCTLINGDLFKSKEINKDYLTELSDLHQIDKNTPITTRIFSKQRLVNFNFEEYDPNNVIIINSPDRIKDIYKLPFKDNDCNGKSKDIIFKYNIELFSWGQNTFLNYWTTDGDMTIYYKNSSDFDGTFFAQNKLEKDVIFESRTHLDIFKIICNKPGTFYIRPLKKTFSETTHELSQNNLVDIEIFKGTEIVQLNSPVKNPPPHIYFYITTFSDNEIIISPDTEGLFNEAKIDSKNRNFTLEIDAKKYKMDQMAIKLTSDKFNEIEIIETSDCESCTYQQIKNNINENDFEINKNNFVIFLDDKITKMVFDFNKPQQEEIAYGIVELTTDDIKYLPIAFSFEETKKEKLGDRITIDVNQKMEKNKNKPYRAFIFSMKTDSFKNYKIDIEIIGNNREKLFNNILMVSLLVSIIILLVLFATFIMKKCYKKNKYYDTEDSLLP